MATPFLGQIFQYAFNYAPQDYALCTGATLPISQNGALFALLGTAFGGNGRTDFAIPDLRGRVPVHPGPLDYHPSVQRGTKGGFENVTLTTLNLPPHRHRMQATTESGTSFAFGGNVLASSTQTTLPYGFSSSNQVTQNTGTCDPVGGSQSHNNMQPSLVINFSIALDGVFPPRS